MDFNEEAKAETQRLSILLDKTNTLCALFRTSDIPRVYLDNAKMLRNPKNAQSISFNEATAIETALGAFKKTRDGTIDKRTISNKKLNHLLDTLKAATTIAPENYLRYPVTLSPAQSFTDATSLWCLPIDGPSQKEIRADRQMTRVEFTELQAHIDEIEDLLICRSFIFHIDPRNIDVVFEQIEPIAA